MLPELALVKMLAVMLTIVLLVLLAVWAYRYVQYRRAVRLAQMRWLHFDSAAPAGKGADVTAAPTTASFDWSASDTAILLEQQQHQIHLLSPIIEERGSESLDSLGSARRDQRQPPHAFKTYGSIEFP